MRNCHGISNCVHADRRLSTLTRVWPYASPTALRAQDPAHHVTPTRREGAQRSCTRSACCRETPTRRRVVAERSSWGTSTTRVTCQVRTVPSWLFKDSGGHTSGVRRVTCARELHNGRPRMARGPLYALEAPHQRGFRQARALALRVRTPPPRGRSDHPWARRRGMTHPWRRVPRAAALPCGGRER